MSTARGDTAGVLQIESRAPMTMLLRLRPRCCHDLVIEVSIVHELFEPRLAAVPPGGGTRDYC